MTSPHPRAGRQAGSAPAVSHPAHPVHAPHAALLIDFDNVTMGIRSDLTKELKNLLNSDIIRGKVTVQRAYADWRRYPQYIMPLTERSIDMIWATAVGATKKNATDIRLAIDAIELVFTRPEIGTFIVLSGDSDFSSLVLKLKEYGKYVIGIGIRESASDLLIQNCDEYYSYSELAGLTKEIDAPSVQRDPWELVKAAVTQMARQGDVMRSDRLKQVMQQIDPNFDERNAGFNRFSKFVQEAGNRNLLRITKLDNGQFEVSPPDLAPAPAALAEPVRESDNGRGRGRGRRGRGREGGRREEERPARGRGERAPRTAADTSVGPSGHLTLGGAFALLGRAVDELGKPVSHDALRARMAALHGREDPLLESSRFVKFLRQANDADIAEVRKLGENEYEVAPSRASRARAGAQPRPSAEPTLPPAVEPPFEIPDQAAEAPPVAAEPARAATPVAPAPAPAGAPAAAPAAPAATLRFRRGSRGGAVRPQAIPMVGVVAPDEATEPAVEAPPSTAPKKRTRKTGTGSRSRTTGRRSADAADAPAAEPAAAPAAEPAAPRASRGRGRSRGKKT